MSMKIYLSGTIYGNYRAQNIIKALSDNGVAYLITPASFYTGKFHGRHLKSLVRYIVSILFMPARIWFIAVSTHLLVLPMNFSLFVIIDLLIAKLFRKIIIVDYYIGLYDTYVNDRKTVKHDGIQAKLMRLKDRLLLTMASKVIFLNQSEADYYQYVANVRVDVDKIAIIPLCIDYKKEVFNVKHNAMTKRGALNVCWWGTYIPLHGLEKVIKAFVYLKETEIKLYLFGDSDEKAAPYMRMIEEHGVMHSIYIDNSISFVNGRLAPYLKQYCDIALGNFGDSEKARTVLVNKLVDALSLGVPCLTMKTKAIDELLFDKNCLYFCDATPEDIASKLSEIANNHQELHEKAVSGFDAYLELFTPDVFRNKLMTTLTSA